MSNSRWNCRSNSANHDNTITKRLGVEMLEDRRMLAAFELSSLLADNGGDGSTGFVASGPSELTGNFVSVSSDINDDGYADLLVVDPDFNPIAQGKPRGRKNPDVTEGAVFVVYGTAQGIPAELDLLSLDGTDGFAIYGNPDDGNANLATMVASGGDVNADGIDDIVISQPFAQPQGQTTKGRVYVLYGNAAWGSSELPSSFELQSLTTAHGGDGTQGFVITGSEVDTSFGESAALGGDVNGDGTSDLILGSQFYNDSAGQTVVVFGRDSANPFPAELSTSVLDGSNGLAINGIAATDYSGYSVSTGGDLNGDLVEDIVIGARRGTPDQQRINAGQVFVVYGDTSFPSTIELSDILAGNGTAGFVINGIRGDTGDAETFVSGDRAGVAVHSGGDFNGDGYSDLAIGAALAANDSGAVKVGEAYVVYGRDTVENPFSAIMELSDLNGVNGITLRGLDEGDNLAQHVAFVNFNNDAYADLVLAAPGGDPNGRTDAGETYVVFGTPDVSAGGIIDLAAIVAGDGSAGIVINGIDAGDSSGGIAKSINYNGNGLGTGDFNGDGIDDVALGTGYDTPEAYVVFGGANIIPPPPAPSFSVNDVAVIEGDSGTVIAEFTVTRAGDANQTATVDFATADGTATTADGDYTALPTTTLTFDPGVTALPVSVTVIGDTQPEGDQTFLVNLTNASAGATITDGQGVGTIQDDDAPFDPNAIYVWDIDSTTRDRGSRTDFRILIDINSDSDADGLASGADSRAAGVLVTVDLYTAGGAYIDTYTGTTNSQGRFQTAWIKGLALGDYRAEVTDLALAGFSWDPFGTLDPTDNDEDFDNDGFPDELLTLA